MALNSNQNNLDINFPARSNQPKCPKQIFDGIYAFPPNRDILGGTAYFLVNAQGNTLIDFPPWHQETQKFLEDLGGIRWLIFTHRGGIGNKVLTFQKYFGCEVVINHREAYLLPEVEKTAFEKEYTISSHLKVIWTPGHSPGSSCIYYNVFGGILFSGRTILPTADGGISPLRTAKTFHWLRQLRSIENLRLLFSPDTLDYICPGASTGYLRGRGFIPNAYQILRNLELDSLQNLEALL